MLRARGTLWVGVAVLIAAGCGFTAPPIRYFEIRPEAVGTQPGPKLPSIMVPDFACLSAYDQLRVVLRKSPVEVMTSRNLQWTTVPGRMLAEGLRSRLSEIGRFEMVRREASPRPPYTVEGLVQLIELREKPKLTARLALQVDVRRTADGEIISEESVDESQPAKGDSPTDGILALQELYSHILDDLSRRIIAAIEKDIQGAKADARRYGIGSKHTFPGAVGSTKPQYCQRRADVRRGATGGRLSRVSPHRPYCLSPLFYDPSSPELREEVVPLVVHENEGGEVHDFYLVDRFHPQFRVL
jgi:ABC-type uncharacterized transport system auxiliary subunit